MVHLTEDAKKARYQSVFDLTFYEFEDINPFCKAQDLRLRRPTIICSAEFWQGELLDKTYNAKLVLWRGSSKEEARRSKKSSLYKEIDFTIKIERNDHYKRVYNIAEKS